MNLVLPQPDNNNNNNKKNYTQRPLININKI